MVVDTVDTAIAEPDQLQPFAELGLKPEEYERIREILGRRPTNAELAMYSVMWSEHCSYKSSKYHLRRLAEIKTPTKVLAGIGENAGVVDIGDGWAATFKVESHNHPSYIEPYQGAATGVGGIVRDVVAMGARPVAIMDSLRFGLPEETDTQRVIGGVVAGISGYGNCLGLPNIGGETKVHASYGANPLVNALCVGVMRHEDVHFSKASGQGNKVVLYGARTGGDGIGGVSILASETFDGSKSAKRPSVQVGDPFTEKLLIEATMQMFDQQLVEGIQDLGGAGLSCATSELASNGNCGMHVELDRVPLRDSELSPEEILMSESQERMCAIVKPENLPGFMSICDRWGLDANVIGEIVDEPRLIVTWHGERIVDVPPRSVAHDGPVYQRELEAPVVPRRPEKGEIETRLEGWLQAVDIKEQLLMVLQHADVADVSAITNQYDRYVRGNTVAASTSDAGVVRVDDSLTKGVAISLDGNGRACKIDPELGTQWLVNEAARNVAVVGAEPLALTNCLNFGSPEVPKVMGEFVASVRGLEKAATEFRLPITGGNVSFYNQTADQAILPTPIIGVLGVMADVSHVISSHGSKPDDQVFLLGELPEDLAGSLWLEVAAERNSEPSIFESFGIPSLDYVKQKRINEFLKECSDRKILNAAHDVSEGGLAITLVEMLGRFDDASGNMGNASTSEALTFVMDIPRTQISPTMLFGEFTGGVVAAVSGEKVAALKEVAARFEVPTLRLGEFRRIDERTNAIDFSGEFQVTYQELFDAREKGKLLN